MPPTSPFRVVGFGAQAWNPRTRAPIDPLSEDEARARHDAGEAYGAVLTGAPEGALELPVVGLTVNEHGITVAFHHHDPARSDLVVVWRQDEPGARYRPAQVDRRAGNKRHVPRDQLVYEYLKLTVDPALRVRMTDAGSEVLEERSVDLDAVALDPPAFGTYDGFVDPGVVVRLWPGLPEIPWVGPEQPVGP